MGIRTKIYARSIGALALVALVAGIFTAERQGNEQAASPPSNGIHKIKHVVVIMQENRSFDSYFGTYPGADGIPMKNGVPTVCIPTPQVKHGCIKPFHDRADLNLGGPHVGADAPADID